MSEIEILLLALIRIRDTAKKWEGRKEAPYWNLGDIAAKALTEYTAAQQSVQADKDREEDCPCGGKHVPEPVCKNCGLRYLPVVQTGVHEVNVMRGDLFFKFWKDELALQIGDNDIVILPAKNETIEILAEAILYIRQEKATQQSVRRKATPCENHTRYMACGYKYCPDCGNPLSG